MRPTRSPVLRALELLSVLVLLLAFLGAAAPPAAAALPIRPDARVKLVGDTTWLGNDVYNSTGVSQTRTANALPGATVEFRISLQNDGRAGSFRVRGTAGAPPFGSAYLVNGQGVTSRVTAGTYATGTLARTAARILTLRIVVSPAAAVGASRTYAVTMTSTANTLKKDTVKVQVTVVAPSNRPPQWPDPMSIGLVTEFHRDGVGNLIGATTTVIINEPAVDPDGDPLTYEWSVTDGSITGAGLTGTWQHVIAAGIVWGGWVTVVARDPGGLTDTWSMYMPNIDPG